MTPRDKTGEEYEDEDEEDEEPETTPLHDDDVTYEDWNTWEDFLAEVGVIDIRNGMIEYETGDNSRLFIMLAEEQQSNPYLKTDEEIEQQQAINEVFLNGINHPLKQTSQSQRVDMTDFLNNLLDSSQNMRGANKNMKLYAEQVINDTLNYQQQTDRFEKRTYIQFMALVLPDEVYGDSPQVIEEQIHEKAYEKLFRQIDRADGIMRRVDHSIVPLDTFGLLEVLYKTFNRESSIKVRWEDIITSQRYSLFTRAEQSDTMYKKVQQMIHIETEAINAKRDALMQENEVQNQSLLKEGKDILSNAEAPKLDLNIEGLEDIR